MKSSEPLENILDEYRHVLRAAVARTLPTHLHADIDDVEQEACIRVWKALSRHLEIERLDSFLYRVGVTTAIDAIRKARSRREDSLDADSETGREFPVAPSTWPDAITRRRAVVNAVRRCLGKLEAKRRRVVGLSLHGFSRREIAGLTQWTEDKIRNLAHRGRKELKACCRKAKIELPDAF